MTDATSSIPPSTYIIGGLSFAVLAGLTYFFLGNSNTDSSKPISQKDLDELVSSSLKSRSEEIKRRRVLQLRKKIINQLKLQRKKRRRKRSQRKKERRRIR